MSDLPDFIEQERELAAVAPGAIKYWTERAMKAERERDQARAALRRLRASARDYAWAEVGRGELTIDMRLSLEAADEALAKPEANSDS